MYIPFSIISFQQIRPTITIHKEEFALYNIVYYIALKYIIGDINIAGYPDKFCYSLNQVILLDKILFYELYFEI